MSKHWKADSDRTRWVQVDGYLQPKRQPWPEGATVGLAMVAAACLAIGVALYQFAGPRDPVEEGAAVDWDKVPSLPTADSRN